MSKKSDLPSRKKVDGHIFVYDEDNEMYECRGGLYHDDEHDEVTEPSLWAAGLKFEKELIDDGYKAELNPSEKGWVDISFTDLD